MLINEYKKFPYPVNLWSAVFQREVTADELPVDWEKALEYALETLPDNKKKEVLIYYFRDGMTWQEIGDIYGTSGEPIRQHANKALRMLKHPSRKVYLLKGLKEKKAIERTEKIDEFARMIGADVYSDLPNVELDPNDITPEEMFRTWAVTKGFMEIRKEPTPERIELMQKERRGEITVEEIKHRLDEKYSKKGTIMRVKNLPYDGEHKVSEKLPEPNVQLCIDCVEPVGGAAALGEDGKWYWTHDGELNEECTFTVDSWCYL